MADGRPSQDMEGMNQVPTIDELTIRAAIREAIGALKMLDYAAMDLVIHGSSRDVKLEEIITDIRVIKGVATVSQGSAIKRLPTGRRVAEVVVSFDPKDMSTHDYVDALATTIRKSKAIDRVILKTVNDRPMRDDQGRRIVY